jgi:Protein of unknown function (DUF4236)
MGGWRFRRTIKVLPGVHVNISKSGVSLSLGGPGATINFNKEGTQTTVGLPGSGVSYRGERSKWRQLGAPDAGSPLLRYGWVIALALAGILYLAGAPRMATALAIVGCAQLVLWAVSGLLRARSRPPQGVTPIASPPPPGSTGLD